MVECDGEEEGESTGGGCTSAACSCQKVEEALVPRSHMQVRKEEKQRKKSPTIVIRSYELINRWKNIVKACN
jgi:hypothetical protein